MNSRAENREVLHRIPRVKNPFFTRFGGRLSPVQLAAIPKVMDGINVVIASPTASGKTEAIMAPLAEQFLSLDWDGLAILYIVPTRALANDCYVRVAEPLNELGISCIIKHGDDPNLPAQQPPNCLITTPESLDSLIVRRTELLAQVKAVVLDEIHLLDNTGRGDQLRVLLKRLRSQLAEGSSLSVHQLSATLSNPHAVAKRYTEVFEVVDAGGHREIAYQAYDTHADVKALVREHRWQKILYFCNMRQAVEEVAAQLGPLWHPYPVVSHHGSLDRSVREETELVMREAKIAVCVATATLEIGIDIGDIDLVVLAEVPWSISALLQRIGRGNRRADTIQVASVLGAEEERRSLVSMIDMARKGHLPEEEYAPDKAVVVQQIFSLLYQHPTGLREEALTNMLSILARVEDVQQILHHLQQKGWVERRLGFWHASTELMDIGEMGSIHSNIANSQDFKVVDVNSGATIGTISGIYDEVFVLGERSWQVVSVTGNTIRAQRFSGPAAAPYFKSHRQVGAFHHLLPRDMKE